MCCSQVDCEVQGIADLMPGRRYALHGQSLPVVSSMGQRGKQASLVGFLCNDESSTLMT